MAEDMTRMPDKEMPKRRSKCFGFTLTKYSLIVLMRLRISTLISNNTLIITCDKCMALDNTKNEYSMIFSALERSFTKTTRNSVKMEMEVKTSASSIPLIQGKEVKADKIRMAIKATTG